jgi:hypothetical protein
MEVDALKRHRTVPGTCYRCGKSGHLLRHCPQRVDIRAMPVEDQTYLLEQLLAAVDVRETQAHLHDDSEDRSEEEVLKEDFVEGRG